MVSQPRITPEGKAQADSKAQHTRQYVSISRGLQRRHQGSDGVMKPLLRSSTTFWRGPGATSQPPVTGILTSTRCSLWSSTSGMVLSCCSMPSTVTRISPFPAGVCSGDSRIAAEWKTPNFFQALPIRGKRHNPSLRKSSGAALGRPRPAGEPAKTLETVHRTSKV